MDTADGVLISLLFSFPEMFKSEGYTLSDRINNSVICNCLHNYSRFQKKLKLVRKTTRHAFMNHQPLKVDDDQLRDMSYMVLPMKLFRDNITVTSKSFMFRMGMFCQTRATGLAGQTQLQEAIEDFITSSQEEKDFEPNELLSYCIDQVTSDLANQSDHYGTNPEFRVSMSTSACRESSQRHEGKFGYLKTLVRDCEMSIPPLLAGEGGTLGNFLWPEAIQKIADDDKDIMKVNVAAVRENGKARVITSGSFWKEVALQPFSHITINAIKVNKNLRSGLKAARLGWETIKEIEYHEDGRDGMNWIFDRRKSIYLFTNDWKRATDGPSPAMGRALTGKFLEKTGLDPETLERVLKVWLGPKEIFYKGKSRGFIKKGILMGDPLTKTNLSLAHPVCDLYARLKTHALCLERGNGDDTAAFTDSPEYAEAHTEAAEMLGYEQDPLDFVVSKTWGIYSEELFHVPTSRANTCKWGTRFKNSKLLPYLDLPKIRVMLATCKDKIDFSSDPRGKVTLLGHDEEYIDRNDPSPLKTIFAIASGVQDIQLATIDYPVPLFLPRQVNGVGKPPPFWSVDSYLNILKRCTPWHRKYYLTVMDEYIRGIEGITGHRGALKEHNHFSKEMMVELFEIPQDSKLRKHLMVERDQWSLYPQGVLAKLVTLGYLVPETKLAKYYLFQERLNKLEQDTQRDLFEVVKAEMVRYPDVDPEREEQLVSKFVMTYRDTPYQLKFDRREPLYSQDVIRLLDSGNPLTVTSSGYSLIDRFKRRIPPDTEYQLRGRDLYDYFLGVHHAIRHGQLDRIDDPPQDILEDDPIIIQKVSNETSHLIVIVTDDQKLYRLLLNKFPSKSISRMSVTHFLQTRLSLKNEGKLESTIPTDILDLLAESDGSDQEDLDFLFQPGVDDDYARKQYTKHFKDCVATVFPNIGTCILYDEGSIESLENQYNEDSSGVLYKTVGIPWTKDIKSQNLEKKPHHGFSSGILPKTFGEVMFPRNLMGSTEYRNLQRVNRDLARHR